MTPARGDRLVIAATQRRRTVVGLIGSARQRLALSIFRCNDAAVLDALAAAVERGVQVRAIVTDRAKSSGRKLERLRGWLLERGVEVRRYAPAVKYHAKYIVADDTTALIASLNFTGACFERTCDFMLVSTDPGVAGGLGQMFTADWERRPAALTPPQLERLIVGPDHRPRQRFASLVLQARQRIRILDTKLTDPYMEWLLESRRRAGVSVEVARRRDIAPLVPHGRLLIVDDATAVIGSFALSAGALERRRELAVVTREASIIGELDRFWQAQCSRRSTRVTEYAGLEVRP